MFQLKKIENGRMNVPEPEFHEATASEAISYGEALVLVSGKLTKCGATTVPTYVALGECTAAATKRRVPVMRVTKAMLFETTIQASPASLFVGNKVTLHTDGLQVTATTTSGVAEIASLDGATAAGDSITVRF